MSHLFISYVAEDQAIALAVARALRERGYSTWTYQENGLPGVSYLEQVHEAIRICAAFVLVISPGSISARQVTKEIESANEGGKRFVPLRAGISHAEFQTRNPIMRMAVGTSVSIEVSEHDAAAVAGRIVAALDLLGVERGDTGPRTAMEIPRPAKPASYSAERQRGPGSPLTARVALVLMLPALYGGLRFLGGIVPTVRYQTGYGRLAGASFWLIALATALLAIAVVLHFAAGGSFSWALPSILGALCAAIAWRLLEQRFWP